jgi:hypothetical protein
MSPALLGLSLLALLPPGAALAATEDLAPIGLRVADSEDAGGPKGLRIVAVQKGSTAFLAGFQPGDLITAMDQVPRLNAKTVSSWLQRFDSGDTLGITWRFVVDGELSAKPITTGLMVGLLQDGPWLEQMEPADVDPRTKRAIGGIRYFEWFAWPDRPPAAGVAEAIREAAAQFPVQLEQATKKVAGLACAAERYRVIDELAKSLRVSHYCGIGSTFATYYKDDLLKANNQACAAQSAASGTGQKPCDPTPAAYQKKNNGDVLYVLESGCTRTLSPKEQLVVAGLGQKLFKECHLPKAPRSREKLELFLSSSAFAGIVGREYSNPDLGKGLQDQGKSAASYIAGLAMAKGIPCEGSLAAKLADDIVRYLDRTGGGPGEGGSQFVEECVIYYKGRYTREQCQCVADVGRAVIPDIHNGGFSPVIIKSITQRNPFLGMKLTSRCRIGNY